MKLVASPYEDVVKFSRELAYYPTPNFTGISCYSDGGDLMAMVGYDNWTPNSVQMHIWIRNPMALRGHLLTKEAFRYPHRHGRNVFIGWCPEDNTAARKFQKFLGFKETHRIKDAWQPGVDIVVVEMRADDCRWLKETH